ncbi:PA0069 family radical SAM protein [Oceaniovalibus sp. ACAM 378]|uniref:PA0069 family radical SAM protein n=1 Tax=Oceaniovalibus sp. ACAM 378 TaxID=2599923 RepID=UPI0011D58A0E|nr:PA0069 family radical SAM protein [Oceaniovalibus sp. ACAM 378]TYB87742.1 PA0069 family radical SAM protein [Oceaniovalibus sp. ACAM 378]
MDSETDQTIPAQRRRGRGALSNPDVRFDPYTRVTEPDGWDREEDLPPLRTEVSIEVPRRVITRNTSPDISFDRSINPYRGCEHGCIYCFARPSHAYLGLSPGLDFETRLIARPAAPRQLAKELSAKKYKVAPIAIGTNTDPYQPIEKARGIMRGCLEVLSEFRHPVTVATKGTLIERDADILGEMGQAGLARVGISLTTLDATLARRLEPRVPSPLRRLKAIEALAKAGCPVRVMVSPVIPGLTDPEIEAILKSARDAGAVAASWIMLRLPFEVSPLFSRWLREHYPDRASKVMSRLREMHGGKEYSAEWHHRMQGSGVYADLIAQRFELACGRLGLSEALPKLRCDLFHVPPRPGDQLTLF